MGIVRNGVVGQADLTAELRRAWAAAPGPGLTASEAMAPVALGRDAVAAVAGEYPADRLTGVARFLAALGRAGGRDEAWRVAAGMTGPDRLAYLAGDLTDEELLARRLTSPSGAGGRSRSPGGGSELRTGPGRRSGRCTSGCSSRGRRGGPAGRC